MPERSSTISVPNSADWWPPVSELPMPRRWKYWVYFIWIVERWELQIVRHAWNYYWDFLVCRWYCQEEGCAFQVWALCTDDNSIFCQLPWDYVSKMYAQLTNEIKKSASHNQQSNCLHSSWYLLFFFKGDGTSSLKAWSTRTAIFHCFYTSIDSTPLILAIQMAMIFTSFDPPQRINQEHTDISFWVGADWNGICR